MNKKSKGLSVQRQNRVSLNWRKTGQRKSGYYGKKNIFIINKRQKIHYSVKLYCVN